ncbi:uncharacterized protein [Typha latifolia]|uniref:uncharacterized protein n=1 Tax=Typha latifolia TaxID=4733 RepID=UPI003C2F2B14
MVFEHKKQPFTPEQSDQPNCTNLRGLEYDGQLASFNEVSLSGNLPEKLQTSDCVREENFNKSEQSSRPPNYILNDNSTSSLHNTFSLSWVPGGTSEAKKLEHNKRPHCDVKPYQVAHKRPKQVDQNKCLDIFEVVPSSNSTFEGPSASGSSDRVFQSREADPVSRTFSSCVNLPWFTCNFSRKGVSLDSHFRAPILPSYFEDHQQAAEFYHTEDISSPIFEYPPRKHVAIGPNHQAVVPVWKPRDLKNTSGGSDCCVAVPHVNDEDGIGNCVMQMPDSDSEASEVRTICNKIDCCCPDEGSIRCVRQHVMEARENVKRTLGEDKFEELGFCEMGENVALKWTEEEEQLFQEVVLSNPASLGKNFWDDLPDVFPIKNSKELVSYYFNVFMLRKRAGQNRTDPMNVDSDNDEWQESDEGEFAATEEDEEDSVVESLTDRDGVTCNQYCVGGDVHEEPERDDCNDYSIPIEGKWESCCLLKEGSDMEAKPLPSVQLTDKKLQAGVEDVDVQDESCTSFEGHCGGQDDKMQHGVTLGHEDLHMEYRNDGLSGITDNGLFDGHYDPKTWDISFIHRKGRDDFLSTCNVIDEVIGMGAWENTHMDGHGIS